MHPSRFNDYPKRHQLQPRFTQLRFVTDGTERDALRRRFAGAMVEALGPNQEAVYNNTCNVQWWNGEAALEYTRELLVYHTFSGPEVEESEEWIWFFQTGSAAERTAELWCLLNAPHLWKEAHPYAYGDTRDF